MSCITDLKQKIRVDWLFLEEALTKVGFDTKWIKWVMECVKSVRYSIRLNGTLLDPFTPSRGLRQGDPLSPFLFLSVAEGLSNLIKRESIHGNLEELKIVRRAPGISHLLFADDSLLFFKGTVEQAIKIINTLSTYEKGIESSTRTNALFFWETSAT
jgi:hypothetical protein